MRLVSGARLGVSLALQILIFFIHMSLIVFHILQPDRYARFSVRFLSICRIWVVSLVAPPIDIKPFKCPVSSPLTLSVHQKVEYLAQPALYSDISWQGQIWTIIQRGIRHDCRVRPWLVSDPTAMDRPSGRDGNQSTFSRRWRSEYSFLTAAWTLPFILQQQIIKYKIIT
jgi:hypothetical protein